MTPKSSSYSDKLWFVYEKLGLITTTLNPNLPSPSSVILSIVFLSILWSGFLDNFYCFLSAWLELWSLKSWDMKCTFLTTNKKKSCKSMWNLTNEIKLTLAKISNLGVFNYFSLSSHCIPERLKSWVQKEYGNRVYMKRTEPVGLALDQTTLIHITFQPQ